MPFNLSQIFGGWRRKEKKPQKPRGKASDFGREKDRGIPPPTPSLEGEGLSASRSKVGGAKSYSELANKLLVSPHVSEKATMLGEGAHVFKVADRANKFAIKQATEDRYGVDVESVNIIAARDKKRRRGQTIGIKSGFKKAILKLKEGQTISEF